ncbi:MAG TPA: hypothetical protein VJX94_29245 [Stellaceae bacterium]|nr:hypothetical protein [Stellaceae bacterium]
MWSTTCKSRQHSMRRLLRWNDVVPPWRYIRSTAARVVAGVDRGQPAAGTLLECGILAGSDFVPELSGHGAVIGAPGIEDRVGPPDGILDLGVLVEQIGPPAARRLPAGELVSTSMPARAMPVMTAL